MSSNAHLSATTAAPTDQPAREAQTAPEETFAHGVPLPYLSVIEVQGPDAGSFLQGQLTQDALSMRMDEARAGGYCSAKGRLLANFVMVHPDAQRWWLLTHASLQEALVKRLRMFVLRAKCTVQSRGDLAVHGEHGTTTPVWNVRSTPAPADPAIGPAGPAWAVGWWGGRSLWVVPAAVGVQPTKQPDPQADPTTQGNDPSGHAWRHADVMAAWPWIEAVTADQFVPQMVNFELLGGVNFRKGCYPGQEVVARSQYRGTLKRRMALLGLTDAANPLAAAGVELFHSEDPGQPAGMVVNAAVDPCVQAQHHLLAEVKLGALATGSLHLGAPDGPRLQVLPLPYPIPSEAGD